MYTMVEYFLLMFVISFAAGLLGPLVGVGGGIIVVPALTLLFQVPLAIAAGVSLIATIATSSGAGFIAYGKNSPANYRIGMLLMTMLGTGAVIGAVFTVFATRSNYEWLVIMIFGAVMLLCAAILILRKNEDFEVHIKGDHVSDYLKLGSTFYDQVQEKKIDYSPTRVFSGMWSMLAAGVLSGMLGIGGGAFNNISINGIMRVPLKVSVATSNFMLGMTAAASLGIYLLSGYVYPLLAVPVVIGILLGSFKGRSMLNHARTPLIREVFFIVLVAVGVEMMLRAVGIA